MINKGAFLDEKCDNCGSYLLDRIGSQYYCKSCQTINCNYQEELRVVPAKYESNCKNKRQLEQQRRLNTLLRQFTDKYRDISSPEEMTVYRDRLVAIKRMTAKKKGCREAAAVVVYFGMLEEIKLTTKEFCRNNNLSIKIFNQKYKIYHQLFASSQALTKIASNQPKMESNRLKIEEKIEQSHPTEKSQDQDVEDSYSESKQEGGLENARHAISLLFEDIFKRYYFREKKQLIIDRLVGKLESVSGKVLVLCKYYENPPLKIYYIIFGLLKSLGHKISYFQYSQIVRDKTGYLLKRKTSTQIKRIYEQLGAVEEELSARMQRQVDVKMQENNSSSRKQSQHLRFRYSN